MNKEIENTIFYQFYDPTRNEQMMQACIFYKDGTVKNTLPELAGYKKGDTVISGEELIARFQEFKVKKDNNSLVVAGPKTLKVVSEAPVKAAVPTSKTQKSTYAPITAEDEEETKRKIAKEIQRMMSEKSKNQKAAAAAATQPTNSTVEQSAVAEEPTEKRNIFSFLSRNRKTKAGKVASTNFKTTSTSEPVKEKGKFSLFGRKTKEGRIKKHTIMPKTEGETVEVVTESGKKTTGKLSLGERFSQFKNKFKPRVAKQAAALTLAGTILASSLTGCGAMNKETAVEQPATGVEYSMTDEIQTQDVRYQELLDKTTNEDLKAIMKHQGENLDMFNRDFANYYIEEGKEIKAALSWDEVIALNLAYNDYSREQIELMFNGSLIDSTALSNAYKNAQLQLMGAYVISNREHPVNMKAFVNDPVAKEFVQKYENLFYDCKEATGSSRVEAVNKFYQEIDKDFPITPDVREVGLSHAEPRSQVKNYMGAIAPMVAASEIMWQNLDIDHTLSDKATAYFNDIGLCNIAEEAFENAADITRRANIYKDQPTYKEFMDAKVAELIYEENYVVNDRQRDISQLDLFQSWVNGHFKFDKDGYNTGTITQNKTETETKTYTETTYRTETTTHTTSNRQEAVDAVGEQAVKGAEQKVDQQIQTENDAAKKEAEAAAAKKEQVLQEQANKETAQNNDKVKQDNKEMEDNIANANSQIANGGTVSEDSLGHGTEFDGEHSDGQGNLNNNVDNITQDGSGAVEHSEPLPDPNVTGEEFENGGTEATTDNQDSTDPTDPTDTTGDAYVDEGLGTYEEPYVNPAAATNEERVDQMIKEMEASSSQTETAKVLVK